jgi:predicted transcriptional regulator
MIYSIGLDNTTSHPFIDFFYNENSSNHMGSFNYRIIFSQLLEFNNAESSNNTMQIGQIVSTYPIGNMINNDNNATVSDRGFYPFVYSNPSVENAVIHGIEIKTLDDILTLSLEIGDFDLTKINQPFNPLSLLSRIEIHNYNFLSDSTYLGIEIGLYYPNGVTIENSEESSEYISNILFLNDTDIINKVQWSKTCLADGSLVGVNKINTVNVNNFYSSIFAFNDTDKKNVIWSFRTGSFDIIPLSFITDYSPNSSETVDSPKFLLNLGYIKLDLVNITIISVLFSFLGVILVFIKKYWMLIIGIFTSIGVTLFVPKRSINAVEVLHHDTRRQIMDFIYMKAENGVLITELKIELKIPLTTLLWHLQILEEFRFIFKTKIKNQIVIISYDYLESFDINLKELELTFSQSEQGKLFLQFFQILEINQSFSYEELTLYTGWHKKTVSRHVKKLLANNIFFIDDQQNKLKIYQSIHEKLKALDNNLEQENSYIKIAEIKEI